MKNSNKNADGFQWVSDPMQMGEHLFTFDGKHIYNLFQDYPYALSDEEKNKFDELNPFWADYFKHRCE